MKVIVDVMLAVAVISVCAKEVDSKVPFSGGEKTPSVHVFAGDDNAKIR